jgi:hypothetical protein
VADREEEDKALWPALAAAVTSLLELLMDETLGCTYGACPGIMYEYEPPLAHCTPATPQPLAPYGLPRPQ